jgi:L-threonylcarbamoyladenylate synthase
MALVTIASLVSGARAGKVISFSTDTVPALAVIPENAKVIFNIKQRSPDKPLILMAASLEELWDYVDTSDPAFSIWQELATERFPGALTLVLPQNPALPSLNAGFTTIGIRIPDHEQAIAVLRQTSPLLTTSANLSGEPALLTMADISLQFPEILVLDDSPNKNNPNRVLTGQPSTVLAWTETGWIVKRQGAVII